MKINKEEYYKLIFEDNIRKEFKIRKTNERTLIEYIKKEVDILIFKILDDNMYKFEYKDNMHKTILKELLEEI